MPRSELVQSLLKGLDLLKLVSLKKGGVRLNELALETGIKKPTLHNLLRTLCARGFLVKDEHGCFHVGGTVLEIAENQQTASRRTRAADLCVELQRKLPGNVVTLAMLSGGSVRCIFRVSPDRPGELQRPPDRNFMPYVSVSSIVLQAVNPFESGMLEEHYPFEEYGIGMWGSIKKFEEAKQLVLKQKYFLRDTGKFISVAFAMPEGFTLGFSFPHEENYSIDNHLKAAEFFRRNVWGE